MEYEYNLSTCYQAKLSLLRQLLMLSESLLHLVELENFNRITELIKKREDLIEQIKRIELKIRYLMNTEKSLAHPSLTCRMEGILQNIALIEQKTKDSLNLKMGKISMQLKSLDTARKLFHRYVPSKKTIPRYLSCHV